MGISSILIKALGLICLGKYLESLASTSEGMGIILAAKSESFAFVTIPSDASRKTTSIGLELSPRGRITSATTVGTFGIQPLT
jgi:hypothetical protein